MKPAVLLTPFILLLSLLPSPVAAEGDFWKAPLALGPTDVAGLAARPGLLLAGGRQTMKDGSLGVVPGPRVPGLFRSTDGGRSWSLAEEVVGDERVPISATPGLLLAPAGRADAYAIFGADVWRSDDHGATWAKAGTIGGVPTTLDVLRDGRIVAGLAGGGLRVGADGGASWATLGSGLPTARINEVLPLTASTILVATETGVFRSTNGGATFARSGVGLAQESAVAYGVGGTPEAGVYLAVPGQSLLSTLVYWSSDLGATWTPRAPVNHLQTIPAATRGAVDVATFAFEAGQRAHELFIGTVAGLYGGYDAVTSDTGPTLSVTGIRWHRLEPDPGARAVGELALVDADPSAEVRETVYAAVKRASVYSVSPGGIGGRWTAPGWYDEIQGGRICSGIVPRPGGVLFVACGRHVVRSDDGGATWQASDRGLPYAPNPIGDMAWYDLTPTADGSLLVTDFAYGLHRSDPSGNNWRQVPFPAPSVMAMAGHPTNANIIYAAGLATNGCCSAPMYKTSDGGLTWRPILEVPLFSWNIATTPLAPNRVFVATQDDGGWLSNDAGETWTQVTVPAEFGGLRDAAFSPLDAKLGWALARRDVKLFLLTTTDGGLTWSTVTDLGDSADGLLPSPWDRETIYVQTWGAGAKVSRDAGQTFATLSSGLPTGPTPQFDNLVASPDEAGRLYATHGMGGIGADPPNLWVYRGLDEEVAGTT